MDCVRPGGGITGLEAVEEQGFKATSAAPEAEFVEPISITVRGDVALAAACLGPVAPLEIAVEVRGPSVTALRPLLDVAAQVEHSLGAYAAGVVTRTLTLIQPLHVIGGIRRLR